MVTIDKDSDDGAWKDYIESVKRYLDITIIDENDEAEE